MFQILVHYNLGCQIVHPLVVWICDEFMLHIERGDEGMIGEIQYCPYFPVKKKKVIFSFAFCHSDPTTLRPPGDLFYALIVYHNSLGNIVRYYCAMFGAYGSNILAAQIRPRWT